MEITRHNFSENLPKIKEAIESANFISIDGEFTGISSHRNINHFDTPEERYKKLKEGTNSYLLIQFGLCTFHYDPKSESYKHKAFNFYIFPRPLHRGAPDHPFLSQPSSLDFLISNGFDFNKLFRDGVSYLATEVCLRLKEKMKDRHEEQIAQVTSSRQELAKNNIPVPEENKEFLNQICEQIDDLIEDQDKKVLDLSPCNSFLRRLVYELVAEKYPQLQTTTQSVPEKRDKFLRVEKVIKPLDLQLQELKKNQNQELQDLEDAVGFCRVIEAISQSKALVVGHNMFLDILNIVQQFVCPLPEKYSDFKSLVKCVLNNFVDTKLIATSDKYKDIIRGTSLPDLVSQLQDFPFKLQNIKAMEGFRGYVLNEGQLHEAGYDAFLTGSVFIALYKHLCKVQKVSEPITPESTVLAPFLNKVFMMQSYDLNFYDFDKEDKLPCRNHVFFIEFPREWRMSNLIELFSKYGKIFVSWLGDTSAFVCLYHPNNASDVRQDLVDKNCTGRKFSVIPYSVFKSRGSKNSFKASRKHSLGEGEESESPAPSKKLKAASTSQTKTPTSRKTSPDSAQRPKPSPALNLFEEPDSW